MTHKIYFILLAWYVVFRVQAQDAFVSQELTTSASLYNYYDQLIALF